MMKFIKFKVICVLFFLSVPYVYSQQIDTVTFEKVSLPRTEVRYIKSTIISDEIKIFISLPSDYASTQKKYSVLYLTDANLMFAATTQISRMMQIGGELPELIIVGLGYRTDNWYKVFEFRSRDLTPTTITGSGNNGFHTGEAEQFLRFIKEELFPFIKDNYRVSEDAGYAGYSYGGLFGTYVLFHQPELFQRYIIGSPSLWFDDFIILRYESEYAAGHADLSARVFMSIGELEPRAYTETETTTNVSQLQDSLLSRHYPNLRLKTMVLNGETHLSGVTTAISQGLREIYRE